MQLQHLKTFVRVVDAGGVTRAAEQLALTQPAVSKQLSLLEAQLDAKLLVRQGRKLRLTPAGELFYNYARRIASLVDEAEVAVQQFYQPGQGEVRVGAVSTVGLTALPRVLAHFSAHYPDVRVHVQMGEIQDNVDRLLRGELELALVTVPVAHPQILSVPLYRDAVYLVASPAMADRLPVPVTPEDLSSLDLISYQAPSRFRAYVDGVLEQHGVLPRVLMEFNSHEAIKAMVELGLGLAFMPASVTEPEVAHGRLYTVPVTGLPDLSRVTSLILPTDGHSTPSLVHFLESLYHLYPFDRAELSGWLDPRA